MQHTQVPTGIDDLQRRLSKNEEDIEKHPERILETGDKVIYAVIRSFMNEERQCYPSISKIKTLAKCGQDKVLGAISRLSKAGLLEVETLELPNKTISNLYKFPKTHFDKHFEMFTRSFLLMNLPIDVKEYYMDIQKYILDKGKHENNGIVKYSDEELSEKTGIPLRKIKKYNNYLIKENLLVEEVTDDYNSAGLPVVWKNFQLDKLNQLGLWADAMTDAMLNNTEQISYLNDRLETTEQALKQSNAEIRELKRKLAILESKNASEEYPLN